MNMDSLFSALTGAIIWSIIHGLIIFLLLKLALNLFKDLSAAWRYQLFYACLVLLVIGFLSSFFQIYFSSANEVLIFRSKESIVDAELITTVPLLEQAINSYPVWLPLIYFTGVIAHSLMLILGLYNLHFRTAKNFSPACPSLLNRFAELKNSFGIHKKVVLHFSNRVLVPCTIGFIRPIIIIPIATINGLTAEQVESILLHELAHIKRSDYLANIFQVLMETLIFFNPVTWWLRKQIKIEREFCCDDLVLQNHQDPESYARALFLVERSRAELSNLAMAANGNQKFTLLNRIKRFTTMETKNSNSKQRVLAVLSVLAISSLAWALPANNISGTEGKKEAENLSYQSVKDTVPPAPPAPADLSKDAVIPPVPPVPNIAEPKAPPAPPAPAELKNIKNKRKNVSPLMRDTLKRNEKSAAELEKKFNSPEWKAKVKALELKAAEMEKKFNSPEWKAKIRDMELKGAEMEKKYSSPEWKAKIRDMELMGAEMEKKFNSPEWKSKMLALELKGAEMEKKFNSPEWKAKIRDMELKGAEMEKKFNSPEWKNKIREIEQKATEMEKKFNSPEWKEKIKNLEAAAKEAAEQL